MLLNHTTDGDSMSNQYPQTTTHQPRPDLSPLFSSLRPMVSRKELHISFAFSRKSYLPEARVNKTVAKVEELSDIWRPRARDEVSPFVMNCSFLKCSYSI